MANSSSTGQQDSAPRRWYVFETASIPVYETDIQGTILRCNQACADLFGYSPKEMCSLPSITKVVHADDRKIVLDHLKKIENNAHAPQTVIRGVHKDGSKIFYRPFSHHVDDENVSSAIRTILLDITEMRKTQEALKRSEERYALVVKGANDGIWDWDVLTDTTYYSPRYKAMLGYEEDEFPNTAEAWLKKIHPDDKQKVLDSNLPCVRGEIDQFEVEYRMRHKNGSWRWIHGRGGSLKGEDGKPYRISGTHTDITERKNVEQALQASEEMHSALSRAAFEGIVISENGYILAANHAASALFGYKPGGFIGLYTPDLVIPEHKNIVRNKIKSDHEESYEVMGIRKDGTTFNVQLQGKVFFFRGKKTRVTAMRDISRRIEAESRYQSLFENAIEGIYQSSSNGNLLAVNSSMATILGYESPRELMSTIQDVKKQMYAVPEEYAHLRRLLQQNGHVTGHEIQLIRKDGSIIWASESSRKIHVDDEVRYDGFIEDITGRKINERTSRVLYEISNAVSKTRDLSELYATIHAILDREIDATNFYIALLDEDQTHLTFPYFSDEKDSSFEIVEISELSSSSLTLQVIRTGTPMLINPLTTEQRANTREQKSIGSPAAVWLGVPLSVKNKTIGAMAVQHYTNTERYTEADVKLMTAISEQVAIAIERKATESELFALNEQLESIVLKRTQQLREKAQELKAANKRLQELDRLKSAVISSISHELRTPLTSIRGFAKLTRKEFQRNFGHPETTPESLQNSAKRIIQNLEIVENEGRRLTRLINESLDLSRIESGHMQWNDQETLVEHLIRDAFNAVSGQFAFSKDVRLETSLPEEPVTLHVDSDRIQQVLINLLHNAAKFTKQGKVLLEAEKVAGAVRFSVTDTGIGIPEKERSKIFERFHKRDQGDTLGDIREGAGLGLAICREIVTHYEGSIWVESTPNQGSCFTFDIPLPPDRA